MASNNINISSSTTTPSQSWLSPPPVAPHLPKYSAAADDNNNDNNTYTYTDIDIDTDRPRRDTTNTNTNNSNSNSNTDLKYNYSGLTHSDHDRSRPNLDTADRDFKYNHSGLTSNHSGLIHNHSGLIYDDEEEHISVVPLAQQYPQFSRDRLHVDSSDDEGGDDVGYKNNNNNNHNKSSNSNHFVGKGANYNYSYKRPPSSSAAASRSRSSSTASASLSLPGAPFRTANGRLSHSSAGTALTGYSAGGYRRSTASNHTRSSSGSAPLSTRQIREFSSFGIAPPGSNIPNSKRAGISSEESDTVHVRGMGRRKSYNVNRHSITNAAYYCISSSVYLGLVFGLEMKAPGELIFLPQDIWRFPFLYATIISWALLIFGFFIQCTILGIGRTRNEQIGRRKSYMISLAPNARIPVVISLLWVSVGLITSGIASIFVFMGLKNRAEAIPALARDPFQAYVLPIIGGILSALINAIMALACFIAGIRAITSLKSPKSSSKRSKKSKDSKGKGNGNGRSRSRSRDDLAIPIADGSFGSAQPAGNYESWGSLNNARTNNGHSNSNNIVVPPTAPPRISNEHLPNLSRAEIDKRLDQLEEMGFPNQQQNYEALYASSFVVSVAAQRLMDNYNI